MKIAIIGNPGSGKSTFAKKLHCLLDLPLYHLDQYYWKPGWQRPEKAEFEKIHHALCDKNEWIIEGVATGIFEYRISKADVVIFFDVSRWRCLYRVFKRAISCFGKEYFSSAKGCPERLPDLSLLTYIWKFDRDKKPAIEALLEHYKNKKKIFVVRNSTDLDNLINWFKSDNI